MSSPRCGKEMSVFDVDSFIGHKGVRIRERLHAVIDGFRDESLFLVTVRPPEYHFVSMEILEYITSLENAQCIYVMLNKPFFSVEKQIRNKKTRGKITFIDAVTKMVESRDSKSNGSHSRIQRSPEDCRFINSPENLTDISSSIWESLKAHPEKKTVVFFDSITTLLLYNDNVTVARFIHFITGKMRSWGVSGVLLSTKSPSDEFLLSHTSQFSDGVIDLTEEF